MTAPKVLITYADYAALPDDGRRYELDEGEIAVTPSPPTRHQTVSKNLMYLIESYLREHRAGVLFQSPIDLILSETTVLQPDLLVVLQGRERIITERGVEGPPDLVVEVLSPATVTRDRKSKFQLYARYGVTTIGSPTLTRGGSRPTRSQKARMSRADRWRAMVCYQPIHSPV